MNIKKSLAVVFPGQGSQHVGMLADLIPAYVIVRDTLAQASAILGYDVTELMKNGPEELINQTALTQPLLLIAGVALYRLLLEQTAIEPQYLAGHSLGEYTALVCAGALSFPEAIKLVAERGRLMQSAVPEGEGAMAAIIGLSDEEVAELCHSASEGSVVSPANFNAIGQVVISGERQAVLRVIDLAKSKGAKLAKLLAVSVPSHCELMQGPAKLLEAYLANVNIMTPAIPVIQNVAVNAYDEPQAIRQALIKQLYSPVRWVETIQALAEKGVETVIEIGPGQVLAGLNKRIIKALPIYSLTDQNSLATIKTSLVESVASSLG